MKLMNGTDGNGNVKVSKNFIISLFVVVVLGISGWCLVKVSEAPSTYASISYVDRELMAMGSGLEQLLLKRAELEKERFDTLTCRMDRLYNEIVELRKDMKLIKNNLTD